MTAALGAEPPVASLDPHAPKLSPDDPRLRLGRPAARTLRAGPIVVLMALLLAAVMLAVALAFQAPAPGGKTRAEPSAAPAAPSVPAQIRNAPSYAGAAPGAHAVGHREPPVRPVDEEPPPARGGDKDQEERARAAGILFASGPAGGDRTLAEPPPRAPALEASPAGLGAPLGLGADSDPNLQAHKNAFVSGQGAARAGAALGATVEHPQSPYELQAGTIIPAVLLTAINSDLPGPVVAQVREHVYDTVTGNSLLVPQGSRLLAQYDSMVAWGQERVLLCWNRLLLPNGDSLALSCMPAADLKGAAGLTDQVDEHWWRILKGATVATLLAATGGLAAGDTTSLQPTVGQLMARGAAGQVNQVGQELTRSNLNIQPTITVRPGFSVNVIVTKDMVLPPYPDPPAALGLRHE